MAVCSPDPYAAPSGCSGAVPGTTLVVGCTDPITCQTNAGGLLTPNGCACLSPGTFDANGVCQNGGGVCTMWLGGANLRGCTGTVANAVQMVGDMWACNSGNALNIAPNKYLCPNSPLQASFCMVTGVPQGNCNLTSPMVAPAGAGCAAAVGMPLCSCPIGGGVFTDQSGGRVGCVVP